MMSIAKAEAGTQDERGCCKSNQTTNTTTNTTLISEVQHQIDHQHLLLQSVWTASMIAPQSFCDLQQLL
jgi:hypothetical protein